MASNTSKASTDGEINIEETKYDVQFTTSKGTKKMTNLSYGKLMFELNKHYLKYDHRTLEKSIVDLQLWAVVRGSKLLWLGKESKLGTLIEKAA